MDIVCEVQQQVINKHTTEKKEIVYMFYRLKLYAHCVDACNVLNLSFNIRNKCIIEAEKNCTQKIK